MRRSGGIRAALVINSGVLAAGLLAATAGLQAPAGVPPAAVTGPVEVAPQPLALTGRLAEPARATPRPAGAVRPTAVRPASPARAAGPRTRPPARPAAAAQQPPARPRALALSRSRVPRATTGQQGLTPVAAIRQRLAAELSRSGAGNRTAAVDIDGLDAVYRERPAAAAVPASTTKLYTTLAALQVAGPTSRLRTEVRAARPRQGAVQPGDIYLVAGGDPFLTSAQLDLLARGIAGKGIRRVTGALVLDDSRYDRQVRGPGWKASYVPGESGPLSAFAVDRNAWRTDAPYLADPAMPNLARFRDLLAKRGVSTAGSPRRGRAPAGATVLAARSSVTVAEMVRAINKRSDNFAAELMLKEVGYRAAGQGTTAAGASSATRALRGMGVQVGRQVDGSGLSGDNRQTGQGELSLLTVAAGSPLAGSLRSSLSIACKDGTLLRRMCGTPASGRAQGKTGTLPRVYAIAGHTTTANGKQVRFAILLGSAPDGARARAAMDAAVAYLSGLRV